MLYLEKSLMVLAVAGLLFVLFAILKKAYQVGHEEAYSSIDEPSIWVKAFFMEMIVSIEIFFIIALTYHVFVATMPTSHALFIALIAGVGGKLLIQIKIVKGVRICKNYYKRIKMCSMPKTTRKLSATLSFW